MKYLFILAHPDDETVAPGGTIRKLADSGDEIKVVLATAGGALHSQGKHCKRFKRLNGIRHSRISKSCDCNIGQIRKKEFERACKILGVKETKILNFKDGELNNNLVWGEMELTLIDEIEEYKPEVVVTFDHSGWYFHLDHVAVSVSTMRAVQRTKHKVETLLFNIFHPPGIKMRWPYVYQEKLPITHEVNIKSVMKDKIKAVKAHKSQGLKFLVGSLLSGNLNKEYFQLVLASKKGKKVFEKHKVFKAARK